MTKNPDKILSLLGEILRLARSVPRTTSGLPVKCRIMVWNAASMTMNGVAPALTCDGVYGFGERGRQQELMGRATIVRRGWARVIGRDCKERRCTLEACLPVLELLVEDAAFQPRALPDAEVGVLDGQVGQRAGTVVQRGFVESDQFPDENAAGPPVAGDVVRVHEEQVVVVVDLQQQVARDGVLGEVEWGEDLALRDAAEFLFAQRGWDVAKIDDRQRQLEFGGDDLERMAIAVGLVGRSQDFVPRDDAVQCGFEGRNVPANPSA